MRDNLLISVQGHDGHYMGVDLNMEHHIFVQKVVTVPSINVKISSSSIVIICC